MSEPKTRKCVSETAAPEEKNRPPRKVHEFLVGFVKNTLGTRTSFSNYSVTKKGGLETLTYTAYRTALNKAQNDFEREIDGQEMLAVRLEGGLVISNADQLKFCGSRFVFGRRRFYSFEPSLAQISMEEAGALPVPFRIFAAAGLEIGKARVVERGPSETVVVQVKSYSAGRRTLRDDFRHYTGACLLKINGRYVLFDIDREDIKHKLFNAFIVQLPQPVQSIREAYISLKPNEVLEAEKENRRIERQGEWFFIKRFNKLPELHRPCEALLAMADRPPDASKMGASQIYSHYAPGRTYGVEFPSDELTQNYLAKVKEWETVLYRIQHAVPHNGELYQGNHRPHLAEQFVVHESVRLVSGQVVHSAGEHRDLQLNGWWEALPNKAVQSWQVNGDID